MPETPLHAPGVVSHSRSTVQCAAVFDFRLVAGASWPGAAFTHLHYTWEAQNSHIARLYRHSVHTHGRCAQSLLFWGYDWSRIDLAPARAPPMGLESCVLPREQWLHSRCFGAGFGGSFLQQSGLGQCRTQQYCRLSVEVGVLVETAQNLRKKCKAESLRKVFKNLTWGNKLTKDLEFCFCCECCWWNALKAVLEDNKVRSHYFLWMADLLNE